jgi:hypothetical protein
MTPLQGVPTTRTDTSEDTNTNLSPGETEVASCDDLQDSGVRQGRTSSLKTS